MKKQRSLAVPESEGSEWRRAHACSGLTSRLIVSYIERFRGREALDAVLARAELTDREDELRDENAWFSFETKIALWRAAEEVLDDPQIAEHVGSSVMEFSVASGLKRALRALGSPEFVYRNVVRANSKFNWAHQLVLLERDKGHVRLRYVDMCGLGYHHYDCDYTRGLLATVPQLFGLPAAKVAQPVCGAKGDECCEFDVRWASDMQGLRRWAGALAAVSGLLVIAGVFLGSMLWTVGVGIAVLGGGLLLARALTFQTRRLRTLESRVDEQDEAADRQLASLAALASNVRLDDVLDEVTEQARHAVRGKEFALLLKQAGQTRADRHSGVPDASLRALEAWAAGEEPLLREGPISVDDVSTVPQLRCLADDPDHPLGSICAAPLGFHDEFHGALVAMAHGAAGFLPDDTVALSTYATHAAIALSNARMVGQLERQAMEDPLTSLANRRAFLRACEVEFSRTRRDGGAISVVAIDLDRFKQINDAHGHPYGDEVLCAVADTLRSMVRPHDTVARVGGEEFSILLPETEDVESFEIAERVRLAIAATESDPRLSASAGVATSNGKYSVCESLIEAADRALYAAKRQGRNKTVSSTASWA